MESAFLTSSIDNAPKNDEQADLNAPFSFLEWKQRRPSIIENQASVQYERYVLDWFASNKTKQVDKLFLLRQKYLYLLDQLQLFFSEKEKHEWYNNVNLFDEKELLLSIPYFARKLKQMALYYLKLRKELKNTKLKYNTVGTPAGIEQSLYNLLLNTFSTLNDELEPELKAAVPHLSGARQTLVIQIEELYDDKDYFDVSPTFAISDRFNLLNNATAQFYQTKGIVLSSSDWIFNCLNLSADLTFDTLINSITGTILETTDVELYGQFVSKYLSENKYSVEFETLSSQYELSNIPISEGNNYFYYPKGILNPTVLFEKKLANVSLSSLQIEGATSGTTPETSDTIFVKNGKSIKGAWLRYKEHEDTSELVEAKIKQYDTTSFIFPFPGYGLSGAEIAWTGPSFVTTPEYDFLANTLRSAIDNSYWSYEFDSTTMEPIKLNDTTLVVQGATPNTNPNFADRIVFRTNDSTNLNVPASILGGSWLYKFERAIFPVSPTADNRFLWPFSLVAASQEYPSYFIDNDFSVVCEPVSIVDLNCLNSIGSDSFETSDKIYKFSRYSDDIEQATECCWLSCDGQTLSNHKSFKQNGFNALFNSGTAQKFVWNGPNNTLLDDVFKGVPHKQDCPFTTNIPSVSSSEWSKCTCKQVYYSPFGHSGNFFEDNNGFADFIVKDYSNGIREFDMDSWRDISGLPFKGSTNVAWYKRNSDTGWGEGRWVNNYSPISATPFLLQTGQAYYYKRAQARTSEDSLPPYSLHYPFATSNQGRWIGAKLNEEGEWASSGLQSNMILYPGDVIKYERTPQTTHYLISSQLVEDVSSNRGTAWSTFNYIVSGTPQSTVYLSWPSEQAPIGDTSGQYPPFQLLDIKELYWWKIQHTTIPSISTLIESSFTIVEQTSTVFVPPSSTTFVTLTSKAYNNKTIISFTPPITGVYTVTASAKSNNGTLFLATNIPSLTVVPQYVSKELLIQQGTPSNGFLLEQQLYGWDYLTNKATVGASGAKPYWANLYFDKTIENRFKAALSWGYSNEFIDGYIPDHSPKYSSMSLQYGQTISYERVGSDLNWTQPITFKSYTGSSEWCALSVDASNFSNLSSIYLSRQLKDLNAFPLLTPTDIQLTNILNGLPVEVYYYALNSFTWTISTEIKQQEITDFSQNLNTSAALPWSNLGNRFYSSVAAVPVLDEIYSETNVGGYFVPQHMGASLAVNKDFNPQLKDTNLQGEYLIEDLNIHIGGRGRTKQDQNTLFTWKEQNQWMKEPPTAGKLAGSIKRNLTKTLQTFTPYEESIDQTALGPITPQSRVSPWEGIYGDVWTDSKNEPKSPTGVANVQAWADSQILKQTRLTIDNWTSDIFGNQYALFKELSGKSVSERQFTLGELWVRKNDQSVMPAHQALSAVFGVFSSKSFFNQLTQAGILSIDCYFDTLMIETSSAVVFCPLEYDYENSNITTVYDNCRIIDNLGPTDIRFEQTWMFPKTKNVVVLFTDLRTSSTFTPILYNLNLNDKSYTKIFPLRPDDITNIPLGLNGIHVSEVDRASLHYNSLQQTYLITYKGATDLGKTFIVDFKVEQKEDLILASVDRYLDTSVIGMVVDPPEVTNNAFFNPYTVTIGTPFTFTLSAENTPTSWSVVGVPPFTLSVDNFGVFSGTAAIPGIYYINYSVTNSGGTTVYPLTIEAL